jgi:hypothetical protein
LTITPRALRGVAAASRLNRLTFAHQGVGFGPFNASPMNYFNTRIIGIRTAVTQIHEGLFYFTARRLDQVIALTNKNSTAQKN